MQIRDMQIRNAVEADLEAIVKIYNSTIAGRMVTADLEPISVDSRVSWFHAHAANTYPLWVADQGDDVVGWLSFQPFYGRPAYRATAEVSIYIAAEQRGRGYGRQLLDQAIAQRSTIGLTTLLGFIFAHNQPSLNLFASLGFQRWGYLPAIATLDGMARSLVIMGYPMYADNQGNLNFSTLD